MSTVTAATVEAILRVRDSNFSVSMNNADKAVKKVDQSVKSLSERLNKIGDAASSIGRGLSIGVTSPLLALATAAVKTTTDLDALRQGMVKVTGSSAEAERQLARLKVIARQPGLGFEEAIKGSLRLQSAGLSAKQAEGSLREFGNAIAAVGGGKEQLDGVTVALAQIASKGKVTAEEINQIAERFYGVREAMVKAFGTSDTEILQAAKLTSNEYIDGMVAVLSQDKRVGNSLKNQFETAQDDIKESLDRIGKAIAPRVADVFEKVAKAAERLTSAFERMPKEKQDFLTNLGLGAAFVGPAIAAAGSMAKLAASLADLGVSVGVLKNLAAGGAIALAVTLAFAPHVEAGLETKALNDKTAAQDATLPRYSVMRGHIAQLREFQQSKKRYPGHSPIINPLSEMGKALEAAGIGGDATPAQIDAAIARLGKESIAARGELKAQVKTDSPREAAQRALEAQKKSQQAIFDATARAKRLKAEEEARKERLAEAERKRKEKEDNDRRFREDQARRVKDAQERLAGITLPDIALKQREARQQYQEDKYYGVPGASDLLSQTLRKNALEEISGQIGNFSFSGALSSGGNELAKLANKRQKLRESLAAGLEKLEKDTAPKNSVPLPGPQIDWLRANAPMMNRPMGGTVLGGINRRDADLQRRAMLGGNRAARDGGNIAERAFYDLTEGKDVLGNALERVKQSVFAGIGEEIGRSVERSLRKRLTKVFEDAIGEGIGDKLGKTLEGSLQGINASAGAILSASYNLIAAFSRKKSFGLGTALGLAAGLLIPGAQPFIPALLNFGNSLDNGDIRGAGMAGVSGFLTNMGGSQTTVGGGANTGPADGRSVRRSGSMIIVNHYGDVNGVEDLEGASYRQGRAIERQLSFNG
jgi:tape measure domain-containing protein